MFKSDAEILAHLVTRHHINSIHVTFLRFQFSGRKFEGEIYQMETPKVDFSSANMSLNFRP